MALVRVFDAKHAIMNHEWDVPKICIVKQLFYGCLRVVERYS